MSLEFQAMFFFPKGGGLKVEAPQGLGDIRICNNSPLLTQPSCNFRSSFFPSSKDQSLGKVQLVSTVRQLEN